MNATTIQHYKFKTLSSTKLTLIKCDGQAKTLEVVYRCGTIILINTECLHQASRARTTCYVGFPKLISSADQVFQSSKSCVNSSAKVMSFGKLASLSALGLIK